MTQPRVPTDRPLSELEIFGLLCSYILARGKGDNWLVQIPNFIDISNLGQYGGLDGQALQKFGQENSQLGSRRKLSEFVNRLIARGYLSRAWEQSHSDVFYFVTEDGQKALTDISAILDFQSTAFVDTLKDAALRERCSDVLQRTRNYDSLVRDAFAVLEDRLRTLPEVRSAGNRRGVAANALSPGTGTYTLGDDEGQKQAAFQLYDGILVFMANPVFHSLQNIDAVSDRQIVGFIDTLLGLLTQIQRRTG